jgi:hypothetical protein
MSGQLVLALSQVIGVYFMRKTMVSFVRQLVGLQFSPSWRADLQVIPESMINQEVSFYQLSNFLVHCPQFFPFLQAIRSDSSSSSAETLNKFWGRGMLVGKPHWFVQLHSFQTQHHPQTAIIILWLNSQHNRLLDTVKHSSIMNKVFKEEPTIRPSSADSHKKMYVCLSSST